MKERKEIEHILNEIVHNEERHQTYTYHELQIELLLDIRELLIDQGIALEKGFVPKWGAKLTNPPLESFKK